MTLYKPHHRWLIPQSSIGEGVARGLEKSLLSLVERLAAALIWQNRGGSDTGTGSGNDLNRFGISHKL